MPFGVVTITDPDWGGLGGMRTVTVEPVSLTMGALTEPMATAVAPCRSLPEMTKEPPPVVGDSSTDRPVREGHPPEGWSPWASGPPFGVPQPVAMS